MVASKMEPRRQAMKMPIKQPSEKLITTATLPSTSDQRMSCEMTSLTAVG